MGLTPQETLDIHPSFGAVSAEGARSFTDSAVSAAQTAKVERIMRAATLGEMAEAFGFVYKLSTRDVPYEAEEIVGETADEYFGYAVKEPQRYRPFLNELQSAVGRVASSGIITSPKFILDIGCGTGILTAAIARQFGDTKVYGVDLSADMVSIAERFKRCLPDEMRARLFLKQGSVYDLEALLRDWGIEKVDMIVSRHVFHRLRFPGLALRKTIKTLRPGGAFFMSAFCGDLESEGQRADLVENVKKRITGVNGNVYYNFTRCYLSAVLRAPRKRDYQNLLDGILREHPTSNAAISFDSYHCHMEVNV